MANAAMVRARLAKVWLFSKARRYRALFERLGKRFGDWSFYFFRVLRTFSEATTPRAAMKANTRSFSIAL